MLDFIATPDKACRSQVWQTLLNDIRSAGCDANESVPFLVVLGLVLCLPSFLIFLIFWADSKHYLLGNGNEHVQCIMLFQQLAAHLLAQGEFLSIGLAAANTFIELLEGRGLRLR
jgi:hypothetical protein